jgi:hypothetical protein
VSFTRDFTITLEWSRCYTCGRHYAYEINHDAGCANCAGRRLEHLQQVINGQRRTIRSLKGALTKARKR